jgi:Icc-related predicted phosphoesterase
MKILALSDRVVDLIYSPQLKERYADVDLVVGCGDLPYYYLEFIATLLTAPVLYVHGNHDRPTYMADGRVVSKPEGCTSIEDQVYNFNGVLIGGLGGSMRYNDEATFQYTDLEMRGRMAGMLPGLLANRLRTGRYMDILISHSPPFGIHDGEDLPHTGFKSFLTLMRYAQPSLLLHGHTHIYQPNVPTETRYHNTKVVNVYPSRIIEWPFNG